MEFLLFAIPIIIIVIGGIVLTVVLSDSNKHIKKLDTSSKLELEKLRRETMEQIRKLKNKEYVPEKEITFDNKSFEENIKEQNKKVLELEKQLTEYKNTLKNTNTKLREVDYNFDNTNEKKLIFNKQNLVRGIIAKEYLNRKRRGI